jgi:hypothetical protein
MVGFRGAEERWTALMELRVLACKSENARLDIAPCARTNFVTDVLLVLELIYHGL